jgi:hypothetical protein
MLATEVGSLSVPNLRGAQVVRGPSSAGAEQVLAESWHLVMPGGVRVARPKRRVLLGAGV